MSLSLGKVRSSSISVRSGSGSISIFGFSSLFHVLLRYGIYQSRCDVLFEQLISNGTMRVTRDCPAQIDEYELAFALGIGFYQLPAVVLGMIEHFFGAATLKIIGM